MFVALGTGSIISGAAALGVDAPGAAQAQGLTDGAYRAAMTSIAAHAAQAGLACDRIAVAEREACHARADAEEAWRIAELQASYRRDRESTRRVQRARIVARYYAERAQCEAAAGARRDRCLIEAHARKGRAMLEAAAPYETRS